MIKKMFWKKDPIKLRTIFMGTSSFPAEILEYLLDKKYKIISVYTQPDKKIGRKQEVKASAVKALAQKNKIPVKDVEKFDNITIEELKKQKPDLIIVVAYGKILPKEVLEIPGFGALNIHTSLLPAYRGPSPVQNAILDGEKETGITLMLMDEGIDSGDIIAQEKISIEPDEKFPIVMDKVSKTTKKLIDEKIPLWIERKIEPIPQNEKKAYFCQLIERSDGKIFWNENAFDIYNRFRAFYPWPGVFTFWEINGKNYRIKLNEISLKDEEKRDENYHPGQVLQKDESIFVQTGKGKIRIEEIQVEGKKNTSAKNFVNGYPEFIGSILK